MPLRKERLYKLSKMRHKLFMTEISGTHPSRVRHSQAQGFILRQLSSIVTQLIHSIPEKSIHSMIDHFSLSTLIDYDRNAAGGHRFYGRHPKVFRKFRSNRVVFVQAGGVPKDFRAFIETFQSQTVNIWSQSDLVF